MLKLDTAGDSVGLKQLVPQRPNDIGNGITVDPSNNVLVTGYYSGTADFDPNAGTLNYTSVGVADIFVLKLSSAGNLLWAKSIGSGLDDVGTDIITDNIGNVYHTGHFKFNADFDPGPGIYTLQLRWAHK
ncbi:MAG: SBBP repeat-containing protein [Bacteroidetes bacterium]|nr:SBBP repeat-containing protein [Bacteroidota bacterium]